MAGKAVKVKGASLTDIQTSTLVGRPCENATRHSSANPGGATTLFVFAAGRLELGLLLCPDCARLAAKKPL